MPETDVSTEKVQEDVKHVLDAPSAENVTQIIHDAEPLARDLPVVVEETKAGYKTTEFWLTVVGLAVTASGTVPTPHNATGYIVAAIVVAYAVARGLAKKGVANVKPLSQEQTD